MKSIALGVMASVTVLIFSGCILHTADWAKMSPHKGDVTKVKKGWTRSNVLTVCGRPIRSDEGEGVGVGWEEWIYPTGSIFFYRGEVMLIEARPLDARPVKGKEPQWEGRELVKQTRVGARPLDGFRVP